MAPAVLWEQLRVTGNHMRCGAAKPVGQHVSHVLRSECGTKQRQRHYHAFALHCAGNV
jgi:hypothetical protein